jgi:ABC-type branched-subunit amino acid transport system substrate-binding protein
MQMIKRALLPALAWGLFCLPSFAQILIGQTAGFSGAVSASVKETAEGAQLYIDSVNASGGIAGQQIKIIALDDKFDVAQAAENARILVEEKKVVALFLNRGTPHTEAIFPILKKHGIALIAPSAGAMLLHRPVNRYVFNVRSSYQREAEKAVTHLSSLGLQRIAVVHVDDSFGRDALEGAEAGFVKAKIKPTGIYKVDRDKPNYDLVVPGIVKANAQAVLWFGSGSAVSNGIKALRAGGSFATVATLSNNASEGFIKSLGSVGEGVIVTQVFPSERSGTYALVRQAQELGKAAGVTKISPSMLEGFSAAKVLVEGLRRAGKNPSRAQIIAALESMKKFDLGGMEVNYSPTDHTGLDFIDLSIIGSDGKFMR